MVSTQSVKTTSTLPYDDRQYTAAIRRAKAGGFIGEQASSFLVKEHYAWILKRCGQTLGSQDDALDAAQEVALRMFKSLPDYESRSSLRTWLNAIVHNECVSLIRRRQKHALTTQISSLITLHEESYRHVEEADAATQELVQQAMILLEPEHREVLHLRFYSELPIAEIGQLLDISLSAAKMRLYRAIDALRVSFTLTGEASELFPIPAVAEASPRPAHA